MYLDYWELQRPPFGNVPDSHLFFESPQHEEALFRLLYAVKQKKGVAMLTGEVGAGKTTVSRAFLSRMANESYDVQTITNPALDSVDLIRAILLKLDAFSDSDSKSVLLDRLQDRLAQNIEQGVDTILVIDEAHVIDRRSTFEELRMLLNMQVDNQLLITLILLGQPPLLNKIAAIQPLNERIGIKYHLEPLNFYHALRYVTYRLKNAGAKRGIFSKESVKLIYSNSRGIPLRINNICDRSLLIGLMRKARIVHSGIVQEAIEDLK